MFRIHDDYVNFNRVIFIEQSVCRRYSFNRVGICCHYGTKLIKIKSMCRSSKPRRQIGYSSIHTVKEVASLQAAWTSMLVAYVETGCSS